MTSDSLESWNFVLRFLSCLLGGRPPLALFFPSPLTFPFCPPLPSWGPSGYLRGISIPFQSCWPQRPWKNWVVQVRRRKKDPNGRPFLFVGDLVIGFCHGTLTFYLAFTHVNIIWSILLLLASYVAWRRPFPTFTSGDKSFPAHFPAHIVYDCATKTRNGFKFFFSHLTEPAPAFVFFYYSCGINSTWNNITFL